MSFKHLQLDFLSQPHHANIIAVLRLHDLQHKNTFTQDLVDELLVALDHLDKHADLAVLIITGAEKYFSAGGNLHEMLDKEQGLFAGTPEEVALKYQQGIQKVMQGIYALPVPTIAAINGAAVGAGLGLALTCDMRFAASEAVFAEGFTRIGLIAGDGDAWLLPRVVGSAHAAYLAFTNEKIDAQKALQIGLVNEVVPFEHLLIHAMQVAEKIAAAPLQATQAMKQLLRQGQNQTFSEALQAAAKIQGRLHNSQAHHDAVTNLLVQLSHRV